MIGSSKAGMSCIRVNVGKNFGSEAELRPSTRKYTNVKLHSFTDSIADYLTKHTWTRVSLLIGTISDEKCSKLMTIFAPTVIELELYIEDFISLSEGITMTPIDFPALEEVTFRWTSKKIFEPFLGSENNRLRTVNIEINKTGFHDVVKRFLVQNKQISNLSIRLCNEDYNELFSEDFSSELKLKLQTLSFYWRNTSYVNPEIVENWKKFFLSQKDCLRRLVFECTFDCKSVLQMIVNEMKSLKHLTLVDLDDETILLSESDFTLQPNTSLKQIDVCVNWFIADNMFEELILASLNLELIYLIDLSTKTMKFLAENAKNLKHLIYEEIESGCEEFYRDLVLMRNEKVNSSIEISWDQDFEEDYPELHQNMQFT